MPKLPVILLSLLLAATAACSVGGNACTDKGGVSAVQVEVPAAIRAVLKTVRLELCQGSHCGSVNVPAKGDLLSGDNYLVPLPAFGKGWKPSTKSGLTITGFGRRGQVLLSHTDQFTFDASYPNGKDCDPTVLQHGTGVGGEDLVD